MVNAQVFTGFRFFSQLSLPTQQQMARRAHWTEFEPGAVLYRQGDATTSLYALHSGRVKLYRQSKDKRQILALPTAGDCFGAETLATGAPCPYSAAALSPACLFVLSPETVQELLDEFPDFQEIYLRMITDRLRQFITLVHDLAFRDVTSRLAMVLVARAEIEGKPFMDGVIVERLLSQQEYAEMVGTAREVVYRTFRRFEEDGLIYLTRANIWIRDLEALRAVARREAR